MEGGGDRGMLGACWLTPSLAPHPVGTLSKRIMQRVTEKDAWCPPLACTWVCIGTYIPPHTHIHTHVCTHTILKKKSRCAVWPCLFKVNYVCILIHIFVYHRLTCTCVYFYKHSICRLERSSPHQQWDYAGCPPLRFSITALRCTHDFDKGRLSSGAKETYGVHLFIFPPSK